MLQISSLQFLTELKDNNYKDWFEANRHRYEGARKDFAQLVDAVIAAFQKTEVSIAHIAGATTLFRINRDVRFSKNKAPYKSNLAASINKNGRSALTAGYYIHLQPGGNSFCAAGIWMPEAKYLQSIRQEIDYNLEEWEHIVESKKFKKEAGHLSREAAYVLKREPKGYDKGNPAIEYLRLKSFIAEKPLADTDFLQKNIVPIIVHMFEAVQPLVNFINRAIED